MQHWKVWWVGLLLSGWQGVGDSHAASSKPTTRQAKRVTSVFRTFATLKDAKAEAKRQKKPLLVIVHATWSWPCKQFFKKTLKHPSIAPILKHYLVVKFGVKSAEAKKLTKQLKNVYLPANFMFSPEGKQVEHTIMYYPARHYRPVLLAGLGQGWTFDELKKAAKKRPNDLTLKLELARRGYLRRMRRLSATLYKKLWKADPDNALGLGAWGMYGVARCLVRRNRYAKATKMLEAFLKTYSSRSSAYQEAIRLLLFCYEWHGWDKKHAALLKRYRSLFPEASHAYQ
ncbi:MAG: thioredoxin family protein [Deltaproteobacteria bacterium]|nr:MAG: thioredoxin family protein [Deltaproteobacteria bacterium]